jgi:anti-anti-sigma factor
MTGMQVAEGARGGWHVVSVAGRVDNNAATDLKTALSAAVDAYPQVAVDCSAIDYLSSAGLGALIDGAAVAGRAGKRFIICAPSPRVDLLFKIARLDTQLTIAPTLPS